MPNELYAVTSQTQITDLSPGGQVVPAMQVSFTTKPSGIEGRVNVPISAYSAEEVDRLIRAQVAVIEAVQAL